MTECANEAWTTQALYTASTCNLYVHLPDTRSSSLACLFPQLHQFACVLLLSFSSERIEQALNIAVGEFTYASPFAYDGSNFFTEVTSLFHLTSELFKSILGLAQRSIRSLERCSYRLLTQKFCSNICNSAIAEQQTRSKNGRQRCRDRVTLRIIMA